LKRFANNGHREKTVSRPHARTSIALAVSLACAPAFGATKTWTGSNGTWDSSANNWSGAVVNGDDVVINPSGARTITFAGSGYASNTLTINSLQLTPSNAAGGDTLSLTGGVLNVSSSFSAGASAIVSLQGGTLNLNGSSTLGIVTVASGTLGGSGTVGVAGTYAQSGGTVNGSGSLTIAGAATLTGGAMSGTGTTTASGGLSVGTGTVTLNRTVNTTTYSQSSGTLAGAGTLTASGALTWSGGTMSGAGVTAANAGLTITGTTAALDARTFTNDGAATLGGTLDLRNGATFNNLTGRTFDIQGDFGISNSAGTASFVNAGTFKKSSGTGTSTIAPSFTNTGTVDAQAGTLAFSKGVSGTTGTLQTSGGTLSLGAASTTGTLNVASGTLALGTNNLTVSSAYTNSNFGTGNSYTRRANVTGTGQIIAAGANAATAQQLSGAVGTQTSGNATIAFGNVHVGTSTTQNYQIANANTGGPSLSGAIQTTVNGAALSDARLSGTGVTASNWGAVAAGSNTGNLAVTFTASSAGALTGQKVNILNNFDNTNSQLLSFTGAAYNYADGSATPAPVTLANQHIGGTTSQALTVSNTAAAGSYSERLNASFGSNTGSATNNGGSIGLLAGGASNASAMSVGVDTSSAGAKSGSVALTYVSDGSGTSGLGTTARTGQSVSVSGGVYQYAQPTLASSSIVFANRHVGDSATQALSLSNTSAAPSGYQEALNASTGGVSGSATANGSITALAQGGTDSSMSIALNTSVAGNASGSVTLGFASNGAGTSELGTTELAGQTVTAQGQVNNYANAAFVKTGGAGAFSGAAYSFTLDFGQITMGSGSAMAELALANIGGSALFTDLLSGSFDLSGISSFTLAGFSSFSGIGGQGSFGGLHVTLGDGVVGNFDQVVALSATGYNTSGYAAALPTVTLELQGRVVSAVAPVPEGDTWALILVGMGLLGGRMWTIRRSNGHGRALSMA